MKQALGYRLWVSGNGRRRSEVVPKARRSAFTLAEMMVALAITSLLAVATMHAVAKVHRSNRQLESTSGAVGRDEAVETILRQDLLHAQRLRRTKAGLELESLSRLEAETMELQHLPATVRYGVRCVDERKLLVREQEIKGCKATAELVAVGGRLLTVASDGDKQLTVDKWISVPDEVTVTVGFDDGEELMVLHRRKQ